jgi:uncharacterized protein YndB with AHSA1/START domain
VSEIEREVVLPASPGEVWEAVTDPDRLGEWFGADVDGEPEPGEVLRFKSPEGEERRALVERVEPSRRLTFRWLEEPPSRVDITIEEVPDGSVLRVVERRIEAAVTATPRIGFRALARA